MNAVSAERICSLLLSLFDEDRDIAERFDEFQRETDTGYKTLLKRSRPMRWLISILLAARAPEDYTFYRPSLIKNAGNRWGIMPPSGANDTNGHKYAAYSEFLKPLRARLREALNRPVDLIDVHSFLWFSYSPKEDKAMSSWREKLQEWLQTNSRTIPEDLRQLRAEFVQRFPKEKPADLTLEEYALGHEGTRDSFCYWLERKTRYLGSILGGAASKFGVWFGNDGSWHWVKRYKSADDALTQIKTGLTALVKAVEANRFDTLDRIGREYLGYSISLRCKPLNLYFPDQFLPLYAMNSLGHFASVFGVKLKGEFMEQNRQLLQLLRSYTEFDGFDTHQMMSFLYQCFPPPEDDQKEKVLPPSHAPQNFAFPTELQQLMKITARTRNVLLYGPPGTGKTWLVNHFTNYFLLHHNVSPEAARTYWQSKDSPDARRLRAQVRAEETEATASEEPAFWLMVANETTTDWNWQILFERGEWFFGKRNLARNFEAAKPGDFIFGYLARPPKV